MNRFTAAVLALVLAPAAFAADAKPDAHVREFKVVNIEVKGAKIWTPGTLVVKKGDHVKITLVNLADSGVHAYAIEGYNVDVQVNNKEGDNTKTVEFVADKAGIFRIYCSLHAAHVGGQLIVLK